MYNSTKILSSTTVFNIDNIINVKTVVLLYVLKKCVLNTKSTHLNDFWRIMWHWSNDCWKFNFAITEINYISKDIKTATVTLNCNVFDPINTAIVNIRDFFLLSYWPQKVIENNK